MKVCVKLLSLAAILLVVPSEALLQDLFPGVSSGIQQGLSTVREGFSRMISASPLSNLMPSSLSGGSLLGGGGNSLLGRRGSGSLLDSFPVIGNCDRIASQGVANCMTNFRPSSIGSKGQCCAWRKYRACINGLRSGISWAAQTERCPSHSISRSAINRISDRLVGFPLSQCGSNPCGKSKKSG